MLTADDLEPRKKIITTFRKLYGKRSGVTHGGDKKISETDLYTLMTIAMVTIQKAIENISKFTSQKQFMEMIEEMKLS